jgi:hypothetical protein
MRQGGEQPSPLLNKEGETETYLFEVKMEQDTGFSRGCLWGWGSCGLFTFYETTE